MPALAQPSRTVEAVPPIDRERVHGGRDVPVRPAVGCEAVAAERRDTRRGTGGLDASQFRPDVSKSAAELKASQYFWSASRVNGPVGVNVKLLMPPTSVGVEKVASAAEPECRGCPSR